DGFVSMGHGRALINLDDKEIQLAIYEKIISSGLSVRETEKLVKNLQEKDKKTTSDTSKNKLPSYIDDKMENITEYFSTKVDVKVSRNGKGKLIIPFHSREDFIRLTKLFK
ncbi:chromosome partitioning protein ParB, partial [Sinomicrobium sp. FJxs]|nr:chromosome partitioning protein ParB [Sinomicrobium weinanense]